MKISFLFLFCIQFLSFESNPLTRNEALSNHFSEDKTDDIGYEMYHKLDEAAQKALDLAEEAKSFAEEAGKLQDKEDTELTEQKNSIERNAFLLQNYRTAFRKHFNPEEPSPSRVKRMVEEKAKSKSKKEDKKPKKKKAKGRQIDGDDEADEEGEADDNGDENTEGSGDDDDEVEPKEPEKSEDDPDGTGKGNGNGEYSQDKVENAKKHLLESDDLLQQLQEKFSNILKEFGEDPGIVIAHTDNSTTSSHEEDTDGDRKDGDDAHDDETDDEDDKEKEEHEEKEDTDTETDDEEETGDEGEEGYRKGKSKGKGKQGKKGSKKN